jgi:hypothetical protein
MAVLHPFQLVPALLLPLVLAACWRGRARRGRLVAAALLALAGSEALLLLDDQASFNDFKAIYAPLHVPNSQLLAQRPTPRGLYMLLDDFTERVDTDLSNDAGLLGVAGPPQTFGLYRDGNRLAALPKPPGATAPYAVATLDALPYLLRPHARTLLAGASGGFRVALALALGAGAVDALEPDPVLRGALQQGLGASPPLPPDPRVRVLADGPLAVARANHGYDLIDLSADFLDAAEVNSSAFAAEALATDLAALAPGGIVSIPVSIREFPVYALRMLATARLALLQAGISDPQRHVMVYRSAWNVRILLRAEPWDNASIATMRAFCDARSFDVSFYPGIDIAALRAGIYNDLPAVSFDDGEVTSGAGPDDAIADEAEAVLRGQPSASQAAFNLAPVTLDRPFYYAVLRLDRLGTILRRLEMLPQAEIGQLVNLAVLAQAVLIALLVLAVPLVARRRIHARSSNAPEGGGLLRAVVYFSALGLGFLFIEIFLIEKASFYLNDRTSAFALVLTGMLVFSGLGSMAANRVGRIGLWPVSLVVLGWCAVMLVALQPFLLATLGLPWLARALILLLVVAPVSLALGLPFPLGLSRAAAAGDGFMPWAWGLNGAMSVVATPLANLIAVGFGFERVLLAAALLYCVAQLAHPGQRKSLSCQQITAT